MLVMHLSIINYFQPVPLPFQYQNNFNFVNQNYGINLPSNNCGPIRRPIPVQGSNPIPHVNNCMF